jgi:5-oxoprolinase (ATP-hydrolysing)
MNRSGDTEVKLDAMLEGLLKIANERMAEAVRRISIRQGYRPRDFALVAFGGAGGQHACALAEILEMETVLVPENAGLLSAVGLGRACVEKIAEAQVLRPLNEVEVQLESMIEDLSDRACGQVMEEGVAAGSIEVKRRLVFLRLVGQESSLGVVWRQSGALRQDFRVAYEDHYGYGPGDSAIELESIRVLAGSSQDSGEGSQAVPAKIEGRQRVESREVMFNGEWHAVSVSHRESLVFGAQLDGPSLVFERHCATVIYPGWVCAVDDHGCLVLSRKQEGRRAT